MTTSEHAELAPMLRQMADLLTAQQADGFRVAADRRATATLDTLKTPVSEKLTTVGVFGLVALPAIGHGMASAIVEMLETWRRVALDRLKGELKSERKPLPL